MFNLRQCPVLGHSVSFYMFSRTKHSSEVDILHLLNLSSGTPGVSVVEGPSPGVPAYKLRVNYGNVRVATPDVITAALTRPPGTLLSVHSPGRLSPWFQLTSNLRTGQLVMHYRITADEKLHQNSWPLQQPIKKNALLAPDQRKALQDYRPEREWIFDLRWECLFEFALECLWPRSSRSSSSKPAVRGLVLARRLKAQHRGVGLSMDQIRTTVGA
uniref:(California timema) hypothetical protein n=1 Tax=Timema californicum TaxID=61474 RepID=A0A7R9J103_TIMCA|nr:unnamed protein product [Timema californicum]